MNTETPEPRLTTREITARAEILALIEQCVVLILMIYDDEGRGSAIIHAGKEDALAWMKCGTLDGYAAQVIDDNILKLNHRFAWPLKDEHKRERYEADAAGYRSTGQPVPAYIAAFLAKTSEVVA